MITLLFGEICLSKKDIQINKSLLSYLNDDSFWYKPQFIKTQQYLEIELTITSIVFNCFSEKLYMHIFNTYTYTVIGDFFNSMEEINSVSCLHKVNNQFSYDKYFNIMGYLK